MIDVEWNDNAKEAVEMFYRWGFTDNGLLDEFWDFIDNYPAQTKTVADAVGQEAERWTHTHLGEKCYVVHIDGCAAWVVVQNAGGKIVPTNGLKPIKPTISDKQVALIIEAAAAWGIDPDDCQDYLSKFAVEGDEGECNF